MDISLKFKTISIESGEEAKLSISHSAMKKMIMELVATGYLSTEELITLSISQVRLSDERHLEHVLPESVLAKLNSTYQNIKGEKQ